MGFHSQHNIYAKGIFFSYFFTTASYQTLAAYLYK